MHFCAVHTLHGAFPWDGMSMSPPLQGCIFGKNRLFTGERLSEKAVTRSHKGAECRFGYRHPIRKVFHYCKITQLLSTQTLRIPNGHCISTSGSRHPRLQILFPFHPRWKPDPPTSTTHTTCLAYIPQSWTWYVIPPFLNSNLIYPPFL